MRSLIIILQLCLVSTALAQNFQSGIIIDSVVCTAKPGQSYALYIPSNYDHTLPYPVIFIFEPAARGKLPVSKFQPVAEELGYILIGSNNSQNGSWDVAFNAGEAIFNDALDKYNIDQQRMYTAGFSGGSRVATAVAAITGKVAGVIACGAGFPNISDYHLTAKSNVLYAALVGDKDMNYQEHQQLKQKLDKQKVTNTLTIFPAGHQWPSADVLKLAVYWLELKAGQLGKVVSKAFESDKYFQLASQRADSAKQAGNLLLTYSTYDQLRRDFAGNSKTTTIESAIKDIIHLKEFKKQIKRAEKISQKELAYQKDLSEAFTELYFTRLKVGLDSSLKDMSWWKNKIDEIKRFVDHKDFMTSDMGHRLINFIWARCAESSSNYMNNNDFETALVLNKVWLYAEPNLWGKWNMAKILAHMGDLTFFSYLQEVVDGSRQLNASVITQQPAFANYLSHKRMEIILSQLQ